MMRDLAELSQGMLTRYLAVFLLLNAFVLNGVLWLVSPEPYQETVLQHTWDVLRGRGCDDSWGVMSVSLDYAQEHHDKPLYSELFFERKLKVQYPPSSLFAVAGLRLLVGPESIRTEECTVYDLPTVADVLGWLFILMSAASAAALLEIGLRRQGAPPASGPMLAARFAIVLVLALTFYPLVKAYSLGQIQTWLNGLFALSLLCWATGRKVPSGVLLGLMALVKPHYGLFVLWALLRREWRFAVACAATGILGVLGSIMAYGFENHVDYVRVLTFLAERGETFYPLVKAYTLGQIQTWLNGLFALSLLCWATERKVPAGVLLGLMALVKPHYGLFVLWALLRREWRFATAFAATAIVGVLGSIMVYGFENHVDYVRVLTFLAERGETFYPNQSVNGLLNRVMVLIDPTHWHSLQFDDHSFPPFSPFVYGGTLIASIVLLSTALLRRGNEGDPDRSFDFSTMALSITIASPIAWEHHYGTIFPVLALLLANVIGDRRRLLLLTGSYVLISNYIPVTNLLAETVLNVAQSYLFAAAIVVLVLLHTVRPGWQLALSPSAPRMAVSDAALLR